MKKNYTVRRTGFAKFMDTLPGKIVRWTVIGVVIVGLICVIAFVAVPAISKAVNPPEKVPIKLNDFKDSLKTEAEVSVEEASVSYLQKEAEIDVSRVNCPGRRPSKPACSQRRSAHPG